MASDDIAVGSSSLPIQIQANTEQQEMKHSGNGNAVNIIAKKRPPPMNIGWNELGIEPKRKVLYRNFHQVDFKIYLIEISRNTKKVFILLFPNFEQPEQYLSEVFPEKVAMKLMNDNNNLFENLVKNFYVKFNKLQIEGYHGKSFLKKHENLSVLKSIEQAANQGFSLDENLTKSKVVRNHAYGKESSHSVSVSPDVQNASISE